MHSKYIIGHGGWGDVEGGKGCRSHCIPNSCLQHCLIPRGELAKIRSFLCDGYYALDSFLSTYTVESESDRSIKLKERAGRIYLLRVPAAAFFFLRARRPEWRGLLPVIGSRPST